MTAGLTVPLPARYRVYAYCTCKGIHFASTYHTGRDGIKHTSRRKTSRHATLCPGTLFSEAAAPSSIAKDRAVQTKSAQGSRKSNPATGIRAALSRAAAGAKHFQSPSMTTHPRFTSPPEPKSISFHTASSSLTHTPSSPLAPICRQLYHATFGILHPSAAYHTHRPF